MENNPDVVVFLFYEEVIDIVYIGYMGKEHSIYLEIIKENNDISIIEFGEKQIDEYNICATLDIVIIEIKKDNIKGALKSIFKLRCKKDILIFAILSDCKNEDKILLNNFGVCDYMDEFASNSEFQHKIEMMIRKINYRNVNH